MLPVRYLGVFLVWLAMLVPAQAAAKKRPRSPVKLAHDIKTFSPARRAITASGESTPCRSTADKRLSR